MRGVPREKENPTDGASAGCIGPREWGFAWGEAPTYANYTHIGKTVQ